MGKGGESKERTKEEKGPSKRRGSSVGTTRSQWTSSRPSTPRANDTIIPPRVQHHPTHLPPPTPFSSSSILFSLLLRPSWPHNAFLQLTPPPSPSLAFASFIPLPCRFLIDPSFTSPSSSPLRPFLPPFPSMDSSDGIKSLRLLADRVSRFVHRPPCFVSGGFGSCLSKPISNDSDTLLRHPRYPGTNRMHGRVSWFFLPI